MYAIRSYYDRVFTNLKRMIQIRKSLPEFYNENNYQLVKNSNPHVFTFLRQREWHKTLVVMNVSGQQQSIDAQVLEQSGLGHFIYDVFTERDVLLTNNQVTLEPYQFLWLT